MKCVRPNEFCLKRERAFRLWQGLYPSHRVKNFAVSLSLYFGKSSLTKGLLGFNPKFRETFHDSDYRVVVDCEDVNWLKRVSAYTYQADFPIANFLN